MKILAHYGAAIYISTYTHRMSRCVTEIEDCNFDLCKTPSESGGAIAIADGSLFLNRAVFPNCSALGYECHGGAVSVFSRATDITMKQCVFLWVQGILWTRGCISTKDRDFVAKIVFLNNVKELVVLVDCSSEVVEVGVL